MNKLPQSQQLKQSTSARDGVLPILYNKVTLTKRENPNRDGKNAKLPTLSGRNSKIPRVPSLSKCIYKVQPGNNSRVILASLRRRPWWHAPHPQHQIPAADDTALDDEALHPPQFIWEMYRNKKRYKDSTYVHTVLNHIQHNDCLTTKKGLYYCIKNYCQEQNIDPLTIIPRTFFLSSRPESATAVKSDDMTEFMQYNENLKQLDSCSTLSDADLESGGAKEPVVELDSMENAIWILKPAAMTNRGFGIKVVKGLTAVLDSVNMRVSSKCSETRTDNGSEVIKSNSIEGLTRDASKKAKQMGWIVQAYMERPLLVHGRKFDIRCFVLVTLIPRCGLQGFFFEDIYVRTSSKKYSLSKLSDRETHLTNDAVQKHSKAYGKFEAGNKLTVDEFQQTINEDYPGTPTDIVRGNLLPQIIRLSRLSLAAAADKMKESIINRSFELFGYDYMIDDKFKPYLIEINSNPCLEFACPLLKEVISSVIENTMRVALDTAVPPPSPNSRTRSCSEAVDLLESEPNKFQQIFP